MVAVRILSQADIEHAILRLADDLEDEVHRYAHLSDDAAEAEAAYRAKHARAVLTVGAATGAKVTAVERTAKADLLSVDELRAYRLADGQRSASRERLLSLRARMDALRTLSANVRAQT